MSERSHPQWPRTNPRRLSRPSATSGATSSRPPASSPNDRQRPSSRGIAAMKADDRARRPNALVGSPIERLEDLRFLRGRGEFVDDIHCGGMLHAVILRSAVAHGRIRAIETNAARQRPGVHAVSIAADIGTVPKIPLRQESLPVFTRYEQPVIAVDKVRYVGEPVAIVLAEDAGCAEDALEHVMVDIEPL